MDYIGQHVPHIRQSSAALKESEAAFFVAFMAFTAAPAWWPSACFAKTGALSLSAHPGRL